MSPWDVFFPPWVYAVLVWNLVAVGVRTFFQVLTPLNSTVVSTIRAERLILVINFLSEHMLCLTIKTNKDLRAWCISFGDRWYFSQPERKIVLAKWFKASFESSTTPSKPSHIAIWNWKSLLIIHDCFLSWSTYFVKFIGAETYGSCPCVLLVNLNKAICHHRTSHHGSLKYFFYDEPQSPQDDISRSFVVVLKSLDMISDLHT